MSFTSWLLQSFAGSQRAARRTCKSSSILRPRRHYHPWVETLESRNLLSTLTVLNNADSGPGSLRDRITVAADGDTIRFAPALAGQTITLTSGELSITKNLNIQGLGAANLTISGDSASRVFEVDSGVTATLSRLMLADGMADQGGGIDNAGILTLRDLVLSGNEALGDSSTTGFGGAVFNEPGATISVVHCTFQGNQVVGGPGIGFGGGLMNEGSATVVARGF